MKYLKLCIQFAVILVISSFITSCKKKDTEETVKPDPAGTVSININVTANATPVDLYGGIMEKNDYLYITGTDTTYFSSSYNVHIMLGVDNNINFQALHHYGETSNWGWFPNEASEFVDIGAVKGLAYVTDIPQSGWAKNVSATKGHGYFIRYKRSKNFNDTKFQMYYAALYVEDYLISSTTGGIIGIKLKYKNPY